MDLDEARRLILESQDMPPLSDVVLKLLDVVASQDERIALLRQRVEKLEGARRPLDARSPYDLSAPRMTRGVK